MAFADILAVYRSRPIIDVTVAKLLLLLPTNLERRPKLGELYSQVLDSWTDLQTGLIRVHDQLPAVSKPRTWSTKPTAATTIKY